uniref:Uncharacterized protein n=1 Tax=Arundo donax TaxID=35708 RepID=A0A0A9CH35_ARUDO
MPSSSETVVHFQGLTCQCFFNVLFHFFRSFFSLVSS